MRPVKAVPIVSWQKRHRKAPINAHQSSFYRLSFAPPWHYNSWINHQWCDLNKKPHQNVQKCVRRWVTAPSFCDEIDTVHLPHDISHPFIDSPLLLGSTRSNHKTIHGMTTTRNRIKICEYVPDWPSSPWSLCDEIHSPIIDVTMKPMKPLNPPWSCWSERYWDFLS